MRVEWLSIAIRDRDDQIDYLQERNPRTAIAMGDSIQNSIGMLAEHPYLGRSGRVEGTRELVVGNTPYIVVYRIETQAIVVLRLLHGAQLWPPESKR